MEEQEEQEENTRDRHGWVLYYDGNCGFCAGAVRLLSAIDFFRRITWTPFQDLKEPPHDLCWDDLDRAAYLDTGQGRLHQGYYAFRKLALRLVPLLPLAPIFWLPGMGFAGGAVYRWVAGNRYRLSGCRVPTLKSER